MTKTPEVLGLVIARGGSTRSPGKNIRLLDGIPLIAWTIECAKRTETVSRIVCSTDDPEIRSVADEYGAQTPFVRPGEYARTLSPEIDAVRHALGWLESHDGYVPDLVVLLRPTTPFRRPESVDGAVGVLAGDAGVDSARSVRKCTEHPHKMWVVEGERMTPYAEGRSPNAHNLGYQSLPEVWVQNGSFDVLRPGVIRRSDSQTGRNIYPVKMGYIESIDINYDEDFIFAEAVVGSGKASFRRGAI